jgi:aspartate carbamoyltransferase catalytic subunit
MTVIRSINDFEPTQIDWIIDRALHHRTGEADPRALAKTVVGLVFLETSLRTRIGFAAAAARLGVASIEATSVRSSATSMPESVEDTIRTMAGYSDVIVARVAEPLSIPPDVTVPVLSGGDRGASAEHPSQSLVDLFALQQLPAELNALTIAVCGDLRMRAARSLLLLLSRRQPKRLIVITEPPLTRGLELPSELSDITEFRRLDDIRDVDAVYIVGVPYGELEEDGRTRLRVTNEHLDKLPSRAGVFSPLPVIDEIERAALAHPRVRIFQQSDDGLFVRLALLEFLLGAGPHG